MLKTFGFKEAGCFKINQGKIGRIEFVADYTLNYKKPGVYIIFENNEIKYVGECGDFAKRMKNYEKPPRGAKTSERINELIRKSIIRGNKISVCFLDEELTTKLTLKLFKDKDKILVLEKPDRKLIERVFITKFKPEWNKK
jgi:hypothetical protein